MSISELLSADHGHLAAHLAELERRAAGRDFAGAAHQLAEFRIALARHIAVEEELLFPAFEKVTGVRGAGPLEVMRMEHRQIAASAAALAASLGAHPANEWTAALGELTVRLLAHTGKEDRVLYPRIDAAQGSRAARKLARRVEAHLGCAQSGSPAASGW